MVWEGILLKRATDRLDCLCFQHNIVLLCMNKCFHFDIWLHCLGVGLFRSLGLLTFLNKTWAISSSWWTPWWCKISVRKLLLGSLQVPQGAECLMTFCVVALRKHVMVTEEMTLVVSWTIGLWTAWLDTWLTILSGLTVAPLLFSCTSFRKVTFTYICHLGEASMLHNATKEIVMFSG